MLINLTNHPSTHWSHNQLNVAQKEFGAIVDIAFPVINPEWETNTINQLAIKYTQIIVEKQQNNSPKEIFAVHIQGEHTFVFHMVTLLKEKGITCVASTTRRKAKNLNANTKTSEFNFVKFRKY